MNFATSAIKPQLKKIMFKDYYKILEIDIYSHDGTIKSAFKKQVLKLNSDSHKGENKNEKMNDLIEAKSILLDGKARQKYNKEYIEYTYEVLWRS